MACSCFSVCKEKKMTVILIVIIHTISIQSHVIYPKDGILYYSKFGEKSLNEPHTERRTRMISSSNFLQNFTYYLFRICAILSPIWDYDMSSFYSRRIPIWIMVNTYDRSKWNVYITLSWKYSLETVRTVWNSKNLAVTCKSKSDQVDPRSRSVWIFHGVLHYCPQGKSASRTRKIALAKDLRIQGYTKSGHLIRPQPSSDLPRQIKKNCTRNLIQCSGGQKATP